MSIQPIPPYHTIIYNRYSGADQVIEYTISQLEWDALEAAGWYYGSDTFNPTPTPTPVAAGGCLLSILMFPFNLIRHLF